MKRQVVTLDITFENNYSQITANELMDMLLNKRSTIKNVSIKIVNKKKD